MLMNDEEMAAVLVKYWNDRTVDLGMETDPFGLGEGMDSLTAIDVLLDLEGEFGLNDLPVSLIKCGGYQSRDEFVTLMSENIRRHVAGEAPVCCT